MIRTPSRRRRNNSVSRFAASTPSVIRPRPEVLFDEMMTLNEDKSSGAECISLSPIPTDENQLKFDANKEGAIFESKETRCFEPSQIEAADCVKNTTPVEIREEPIQEVVNPWTPSRARPSSSRPSITQKLTYRKVIPATCPFTPKCARPTKSWINRHAPSNPPHEVEGPRRSTLSVEERQQVWQRLLQAKSRPSI